MHADLIPFIAVAGLILITPILGAIFNLLGLIWLVAFALAVARSRSVLGPPRFRRAQERLTGFVLVALGIPTVRRT